jgi:3-phosphoshikimate 1-carboxyvinyltransferase
MTYQLTAPASLDANVTLPASKSISNRALIIHALSGGATLPCNLSDCDDTNVVIRALRDMPETIDIGAGGTAMRFMTAYLAVTPGEHIITGTERMKQRPIGPLVDALRSLGADISYVEQEGYPPLRIKGHRLSGGQLDISGSVSSQYISALLMIGPTTELGLELHLTGNIVSRPYIELTLFMMKKYGAEADWSSEHTITISPRAYSDTPCTIENDWSAASYWYEIMALYGDCDQRVVLNGLADGSKQGDSAVKYIFSLLGIKTSFGEMKPDEMTTATLTRRMGGVQRLDFDFVNCPDLAQTVVVTCCANEIPFHFSGLGSLKIKETDRIEALKTELRKLGYDVQSANDAELIWDGSHCEPTSDTIDTYEDHRMAMAFAPLAIKLPGLKIRHPEVVSKSYPRFWDDLRQAGFTIEKVDRPYRSSQID